MELVQRLRGKVDRLQRTSAGIAFAYAVVKKFGDDTAGDLAALLTYYGFVSLFPLLLVLVTVLGLVAAGNPSLSRAIEHSALAEFPVIGTDLGKNIHALHRDSLVSLVIGIAGLVWGSQGAVQAGQKAMADVWNVPQPERPGFAPRLARSVLMLAVLGVFLFASTAASGFTSFARTVPAIASVGAMVLTLLLNVVLYLLAFRILTPRVVGWRDLVVGSAAGGAAWTVLQYAGTLLVDHELEGSNVVYGFFGIVLGLLAWLYLGAEATLYAAEVNVVKARRLWPRSVVPPPLTGADRAVYAAVAQQAQRRPGQRVEVVFEEATEAAEAAAHEAPAAGPGPDERSRSG